MTRVGILGAGIAGLSCAWLLNQRGVNTIIFEKQSYPGGLARSFDWHGFACDFAAHRLFSSDESNLQQLLTLVPMGRYIRRSRIYLKGHWLRDPLDVLELVSHVSSVDTLEILWTYLARPRSLVPDSFESYVLQRYGKHLYSLFFQPYTEKLFGIPGQDISVTWARRKVRLASPLDVIRESSKINFRYFYYPIRGGYGAIAQSLYDQVRERVLLETTVVGLETDDDRVTGVVYMRDDQYHTQPVDVLISTLPLTVTGQMLGYQFPLSYRKVDAVYLLINRPFMSDYHWLYFIDEDIAVNRMVEFKNMSPVDKPDKTTVLCAEVTGEYSNVTEKVIRDLERVKLIHASQVLDTMVLREEFAYPIYDRQYEKTLERAGNAFAQFTNLYRVGRAADFEHREVDDNFAAALETVHNILSQIAVRERVKMEKPVSVEMRHKQVWAVVLAFNNCEDTIECLESVTASDYPELQIVVVDNGSTDNTVSIVRERFPQVTVIENGRNLWVPAGYNVGFAHALNVGADYILMLNNDTTIAPDLVSILVEHGEQDTSTGILMPTVLFYDNPDQIWSVGARYRSFPPAIVMDSGSNRVQNLPRFIEYAPSCGLLIRRTAFERAGLFDSGYLFLYDDWDFSERVRAHGMKIQYVPQAHMWHKVSRTTRGPQSSLFWRTFGESGVRFYRRHGRPVWLSLFIHLGYIFLRDFVIKGNWAFLGSFVEGIRSGFDKPLGPVPHVDQVPPRLE
jgi:GT2 family glycosyltransferase/protoporphyrinogen oxidase